MTPYNDGDVLPPGQDEGKRPIEDDNMGADDLVSTASYGQSAGGPGAQIGPYKLLSILGEGGCGIVYLAEQRRPVKRRVALKIIKPGMDSRQVIARFEAERQALALLDHPHIAHVFDGGATETGRPYFVMEYVKGLPITTHCDTHRLSLPDRLKLFMQVCDGVQHAHQKGIIHRDIKPSNILVSLEGDKAIPRVIDFGIAKALSQPLTERTLVTEQGQLVGTPEYMSPEQADRTAQDIDTRSDVYSLGAVLYELLTGVLPFDADGLRSGGIEQIRRIISQEEPKTPSTRVTGLGQDADALAERRRTDVSSLARCLQRELEWIPLKAMRKERTRRYRSASELADDIQNYLDGRPLIAGPESVAYRIRKFVDKRRGAVAAMLTILAAILIGLVTSTALYFRAEDAVDKEAKARQMAQEAEKTAQEQRARAETEAAKAREQAEAYRRALYVSNLAVGDGYLQRGNWLGARELLISCPTDLLGWEWYYLWGLSRQECTTSDGRGLSRSKVLSGHAGWVSSVAFNHDGTRIASGSGDGTVRIWAANDGTQTMLLNDNDGSVTCVAFSPDSQTIAAAYARRVIKLWDAGTGAEILALRDWEGGGNGVTFAPDGKCIASNGMRGVVKILDVAMGRELQTVQTRYDEIFSAAFLAGQDRLVCSGMMGPIEVFDLRTATRVMDLHGHVSMAWCVACSPDGRWIASGGVDNTVRIWDAQTGRTRNVLTGHTRLVQAVAFSPDGRRVVSAGNDGTLRVWDTTTGAQVLSLAADAGTVSSVAFGPAGTSVVSGHEDGGVRIWTAASAEQVAADTNAAARRRDRWTGKLIAWWKFDEADEDTAQDSSGNGLHGTLVGRPQRVPGRVGMALRFDGTDDYIDCGRSPLFDLTGAMTIAAWVWVQEPGHRLGPVITKGDTAWRMQHVRQDYEEKLEFNVSAPRSRPLLILYSRTSLADDRWHHLAATYNGRKICIYIDGKLDVSDSVSPVYDVDTNEEPVHIGATAGMTDRRWSGLIDDVRLYNYALTADEIADLIASE